MPKTTQPRTEIPDTTPEDERLVASIETSLNSLLGNINTFRGLAIRLAARNKELESRIGGLRTLLDGERKANRVITAELEELRRGGRTKP